MFGWRSRKITLCCRAARFAYEEGFESLEHYWKKLLPRLLLKQPSLRSCPGPICMSETGDTHIIYPFSQTVETAGPHELLDSSDDRKTRPSILNWYFSSRPIIQSQHYFLCLNHPFTIAIMVNTGKPSKGCYMCRARRIKVCSEAVRGHRQII